MLREIKVKTVEKDKRSDPFEPLGRLFDALEERGGSEKFVLKAVRSCIEDMSQCGSEDNDVHGEVIGPLFDHELVDLLAEKIYLETLIGACEEKAEAAKRRHRTVRDRFKQVVCDRFDLPDAEPIKVHIGTMTVLRGDREARIEEIKGEVETLFTADEAELMGLIKNEGEDTFQGDLAKVLMGDRREDVIKLCNALFDASEKDKPFLQKVRDDEDVPKPIRVLTDHIIKERGIKCRMKRIIEWS